MPRSQTLRLTIVVGATLLFVRTGWTQSHDVENEEWASELLAEGGEDDGDESATARTQISLTGLAILFVGAGLVALGGWWLSSRRKVPTLDGEPLMDLLHSLRLGPKQQLSVVDVAGRKLVLGVTIDRIDLLLDLGNTPTFAPTAPTRTEPPSDHWRAAYASDLPRSARPQPNRRAASTADDRNFSSLSNTVARLSQAVDGETDKIRARLKTLGNNENAR